MIIEIAVPSTKTSHSEVSLEEQYRFFTMAGLPEDVEVADDKKGYVHIFWLTGKTTHAEKVRYELCVVPKEEATLANILDQLDTVGYRYGCTIVSTRYANYDTSL